MDQKIIVVDNCTNAKEFASRRSRKDEEGRDYQCGCGKRYLSYPALYTHIKTKHDGKQPEGTKKSGINQIAKRTKSKLQQETLKCIYSYFDRFQLRMLIQMGDGLKGSVGVSHRIKKQFVDKQVYDCYLQVIKTNEVRLTGESSLDLALIVYLINCGQQVNEKLYQQLCIFSKIAKNCYSEYGQQIYQAYFSKKQIGPFVLPTFSIYEVKYFPIVSDFIIQCYIPVIYNKEKPQVNLSLMELLIFDFCNWLYTRKLTPIKTHLSKNYKLDYNPSLLKQKSTPNKNELKEKSLKEQDSNSKQLRQDGQDQYDEISQNENEQFYDEEVQYIDKKNQSHSKQKQQNI